MSTVTVYTATRMLAIENNSIVDGEVVGDNLILTRQGGGTVDAGNVRGDTGPQGDPGEVTTAELEAYFPMYDDSADLLADGVSHSALILLNATYGWVLARKQSGVWYASLGPITFSGTADETGVVYFNASTFGFVNILAATANAQWSGAFDALQAAQARVITGDIQIRGYAISEAGVILPADGTVSGSLIMTGKWE